MNLVLIAIILYKTCKSIINYFFVFKLADNSFFNFISNYFEIIKTNNQKMLYFYCFVLLKKMSNLVIFYWTICNNLDFQCYFIKFLDQIIKYKLLLITAYQVALIKASSTIANLNSLYFQIQFNCNSNLVVSQIQIHFLYHNAIYFKYNNNISKY